MLRLKILFAISFLFITTSCSQGSSSFSLLSQTNEFIQTGDGLTNKVDILFVVNDEPSMSSFQDELASSFSTFMQVFQNKGFDFKIAVVTTSGYLADPTLNGYNVNDIAEADFNDFDGTQHSGFFVLDTLTPNLFANFTINSHPVKNSAGQDGRAFSSFRQALSSDRVSNLNFLRSDSFLAIVLVDNQDDFSGNGRCKGCNVSGRYTAPTLDPVSVYSDFLDTLTGTSGISRRYNVSAMTQIANPCQGGSNMIRIMELVDNTKGVLGDICQADFGNSMVNISNNIASLSTQFFLDRIPVESTIAVYVDGVTVLNDAVNGWTYDSVANSIIFHGAAIPAKGSVVSVDYDPAQYGG